MKKYLTEFVGTLFLVLIIGLTQNPLAIGFGLTILVYMGAHISGAHYNPVVSLAMFIKKEIGGIDFIKYYNCSNIGSCPCCIFSLYAFIKYDNPTKFR